MHGVRRVLAVALVVVGCGEGSEPPSRDLCGSSDAAGLGFLVDGGFVDRSYGMTGAYGHRFLLIDRECRYWASAGYLQGLRHGTVTPEQGRKIAADVRFTAFKSLARTPGAVCADAPAIILTDFETRVSFGCTDAEKPGDRGASLRAIQRISMELFAAGRPFEGPIRIAAVASEPNPAALPWTLAWSPAEIPAPETRNGLWTADTGRLVMHADDLAALRALRAQGAAMQFSPGIPVRAGADAFTVYPRDEAPAELWMTLERIRP